MIDKWQCSIIFTNLESFALFNKFNFLDVSLQYYPVIINEFKEKISKFFCGLLAITTIVVPSSSSNLPSKLLYSELIGFVSLDKSIPTSL